MHACHPSCLCDEISPRINGVSNTHFWPVCPIQGVAHRDLALGELVWYSVRDRRWASKSARFECES